MDAKERGDMITNILDMMDRETFFRLNRGLVLMGTPDEEIKVIENYYIRCSAARIK